MDKKKIVTICSIVVGLIVVLLIVIWLMSVLNTKKLTPEEAEPRIAAAAEKYYKDNPTMLPASDGEFTLQYSTLVEGKYIKALSDLIENGEKCSAEILVINQNSNYSYITRLNCPGVYETKELRNVITNDLNIVETGAGLYRGNNNDFYYRGEANNNYILLGKTGEKEENIITGRIVSVESDGTVKVKLSDPVEDKYIWDNRYNETRKSNDGYNIFEKSRIKEKLKSFETDDKILTSTIKSKIVSKPLCIGYRSIEDITKDGSQECSLLSEDSYMFGLISPYEYMRASLDENCNNSKDISCTNYNYLATGNNAWSLTAEAENNYKVYTTGLSGIADSKVANEKRLYLTFYLNKYTFYQSGTGTQSDPYIIK